MGDVVIRDSTVGGRVCAVCAFVVLHPLVVMRVGVLEDDVEGVEDAREDAEAAEGEVDERVCAADAAFDPDCVTMFVSCASEKGMYAGGCLELQGTAAGTHLRWAGRALRAALGSSRFRT
jgi:hypothetical protein